MKFTGCFVWYTFFCWNICKRLTLEQKRLDVVDPVMYKGFLVIIIKRDNFEHFWTITLEKKSDACILWLSISLLILLLMQIQNFRLFCYQNIYPYTEVSIHQHHLSFSKCICLNFYIYIYYVPLVNCFNLSVHTKSIAKHGVQVLQFTQYAGIYFLKQMVIW